MITPFYTQLNSTSLLANESAADSDAATMPASCTEGERPGSSGYACPTRNMPLAGPRKSSPSVTITVSGTAARMNPRVAEVERDLACEQVVFHAGGERGYGSKLKPVIFSTVHGDGSLQFAVGFLPRVVEKLGSIGYQVHLDDTRDFATGCAVDGEFVKSAWREARAVMDAIVKHPMGQIVVGGDRDAVYVAFLICRMFPQARIAFATATNEHASGLRRRLGQALGEGVPLCGPGVSLQPERLSVGTFVQLTRLEYYPADVLVLADGIEATGGVGIGIYKRLDLHNTRVYSIRRVGAALGELSQLTLEAMGGPAIYRADPEPAPVTVMVVESGCFPNAKVGVGLERKRVAFWRHSHRNELIARMAQVVATQDMKALWAMGLFLTFERPPVADLSTWRVTVLVEGPEHGRALRKLLPGWPLLAQLPGALPKRAAGSPGTGTITTMMHADKHGVGGTVLIRADGGGPMAIRGFPPTRDQVTGTRFLIDICDDFDNQTIRDGQARQQAYRRLGWTVAGETARNTRNAGTSGGSGGKGGNTSQ
jgi:hypothetical protein